MRITKYKCDLCQTEHSQEVVSEINLVVANNIFQTASYGGDMIHKFRDICPQCSGKIAVFIRDNLFPKK